MINLEKGQRAKIEIPKFRVGLGWDANATDTGTDFDLDASAFLLGENGKVISDEYFVFYNNLQSPDGAVTHQGDNLTGAGEGDDEGIIVELDKLNKAVAEIHFIVTIHKADERHQNFGQVRNSFIRIVNDANSEEILRYDLEEDFSIETAVDFGRIYRKNGEWKFEAVGTGRKTGLQEYVDKFC